MPTTILSIDGGGIRGVIPAMVLSYIEARTRRPIAELFNVIAGTSTGGIIALALTCPDEGGRPKLTANEVVDLYEANGGRIFPHEVFGKLRQLVDEKYSSRGLEEVLQERFGDAELADALTAVIVTAYDIARRKPIFFRRDRTTDAPDGAAFLMREVALATSAAPTYFEPVRVRAVPPSVDYTLVDGGVFATNPGMCAFVDASAGRARSEEMLMVSLGTGVLTRPLPYDEARNWGLVGWGRRILDVVFDGVSDTVDYQLGQILPGRYHRFQTVLDKAQDDLDDASARNIEKLKLEGDELIAEHRDELDEVCDTLQAAQA